MTECDVHIVVPVFIISRWGDLLSFQENATGIFRVCWNSKT